MFKKKSFFYCFVKKSVYRKSKLKLLLSTHTHPTLMNTEGRAVDDTPFRLCSSREGTQTAAPLPPAVAVLRKARAAWGSLVEPARPPLKSALFPTWNSTALLLARSALLPASAMTMLGLACLCNSFTQFLARAKVSWGNRARASAGQGGPSVQGRSLQRLELTVPRCLRCHHPKDSGETPANTRGNVPTPQTGTTGGEARENLYCVGDVVDHDGSLGPPIVHGGQAVIPLLSSCVPDLKLDCRVI